MDHMNHRESAAAANGRWRWALLGFLAVAGFFLWSEHKAHLMGFLPYLLVAACLLMHLFHHGGHGGHAGHEQPDETTEPRTGAPS